MPSRQAGGQKKKRAGVSPARLLYVKRISKCYSAEEALSRATTPALAGVSGQAHQAAAQEQDRPRLRHELRLLLS